MKKFGKINLKAFIVVAVVAAVTFMRLFSVNVVFDRCLNNDEVATAFQKTSFRSYQASSVSGDGATLFATGNSLLFGNPLKGDALKEALSADRRTHGITVVDGNSSLFDMIRINMSPFVHHIVIYFPILDGGDRDILPRSVTRFFENSPEAMYW